MRNSWLNKFFFLIQMKHASNSLFLKERRCLLTIENLGERWHWGDHLDDVNLHVSFMIQQRKRDIFLVWFFWSELSLVLMTANSGLQCDSVHYPSSTSEKTVSPSSRLPQSRRSTNQSESCSGARSSAIRPSRTPVWRRNHWPNRWVVCHHRTISVGAWGETT